MKNRDRLLLLCVFLLAFAFVFLRSVTFADGEIRWKEECQLVGGEYAHTLLSDSCHR